MRIKSTGNFDEWLSQLVRTSLPFEIQRKIVQCETLTKKELNQFATVLILATQAEALPKISTTADISSQLLGLVTRMERRQREHGKKLHAIDIHTTPPIEDYEELFKDNTEAQRNMFIAGFRLLKSKQFVRPRTAATVVFDDFKRKMIAGRYENKESFCTLFARKWELYNKLPRI